MGRKAVGVGKQISLQALRGWIEVSDQRALLHCHIEKSLPGAKTGLLEAISDVEDRRSLRHCDRNGVDIAPPDAVVDFGRRCGMVKPIGSGLQGSVFPEPGQVKRELAADDP